MSLDSDDSQVFGVDYDRAVLSSTDVTAVGMTFSYFFDPGLSINYRIAFGRSSDNVTYVHVPSGIFIAGWLFEQAFKSDADEDEDCDDWGSDCECEDDASDAFLLGVAGLAMALLPEGLALHLYPTKWLRLSPFINPLGVEFITGGEYEETQTSLSSSIGSTVTFLTETGMNLSANFGFRTLHATGDWGLHWGVGLGVSL